MNTSTISIWAEEPININIKLIAAAASFPCALCVNTTADAAVAGKQHNIIVPSINVINVSVSNQLNTSITSKEV